jgi:hypothetical protein
MSPTVHSLAKVKWRGILSFEKIPKPREQLSQPTYCSSRNCKLDVLQPTGYFQGSYIEWRYCRNLLDSLYTKGVGCSWHLTDRFRRIYGKQLINLHEQNCSICKLTGERHFGLLDLLEY